MNTEIMIMVPDDSSQVRGIVRFGSKRFRLMMLATVTVTATDTDLPAG